MSDSTAFKAKFARLLELREQRDIDKQAAKKSEAVYRECEAELWQELADAGIRGTLKFDFGELGSASFVSRATTYGKVSDKQTAIESLKALGLFDTINEESIREGRLNELVRTMEETHQEFPDGIGSYQRKGISISRK